jgi:flagellar basal-body rod protein FlgC
MADIFSIVGSSLDAQGARMGAIASNLANADSIAAPGTAPYRAHEVVFEATPPDQADGTDGTGGVDGSANANDPTADDPGVSVVGTVLSNAPPKMTYDPNSPYADGQGYVTSSNVSEVNQMVDLIDSSNSYSASVAVLQQADRVDQQILSSFQVS